MSPGVGRLRSWVAVAVIGLLAWELPYATDAALKRQKKTRIIDDLFRTFYPGASVILWVVITVCLELFSKPS